MKGTAVLESADAVARVRAGDVEAFAEIVERYQTPIVGYLYRLTGDHETAKDLAQDTFVRAYSGLSRTTTALPFRAWLYRIATNNALQYRRRKRIVSFLPFNGDPGPGIGTTRDGTESVAVQDILMRLPDKLRTCMVLHFMDGFKYREIAETLGISEDAVRMRVARGSEEFRKLYSAAEGDAT